VSGLLESESVYDLAQMIGDQGMSVVIRNLTTVTGPQPYPNPPSLSADFAVSGTAALHATSITFAGSLVNGRLLAGDAFKLGTDPTLYTIGTLIQSSRNAFTGVSFSPGLVHAATNGESVAFTFSADTTVPALVTSFPSRLVNGTTIQASDKQVRFLASSLSYEPVVTDKIFMFGEVYSIVNPRPIQIQGVIWAWACHVRK